MKRLEPGPLRRLLMFGVPAALAVVAATAVQAQQMADSSFHPTVAHPAYHGAGPRVVIDQAHMNFHTADDRYRPFADLLRLDGYRVEALDARFTPASLRGVDVLVIANALGAEGPASYDTPAFTPDEVQAVHDWVESGGSLLLIADHAPFGAGAEGLARAFGVGMSKGFTQDTAAEDHAGNPTFLRFTRDNGLLGDHAITRGRDQSERVNIVQTFTGQSLTVPPGATALLLLSPTARDRLPPTRAAAESRAERVNRMRDSILADMARNGGRPDTTTVLLVPAAPVVGPPPEFVSAAGRAQGVALEVGRGRVVVLGEAAFLSAQVVVLPGRPMIRMGMNVPGTDDPQFALNMLHWLTRLLD